MCSWVPEWWLQWLGRFLHSSSHHHRGRLLVRGHQLIIFPNNNLNSKQSPSRQAPPPHRFRPSPTLAVAGATLTFGKMYLKTKISTFYLFFQSFNSNSAGCIYCNQPHPTASASHILFLLPFHNMCAHTVWLLSLRFCTLHWSQVSPAPRPPNSCNSDGKLPAELKPTICTQANKDDWSPSQKAITHKRMLGQSRKL